METIPHDPVPPESVPPESAPPEPAPKEPIPGQDRYLTYEQMNLINSFRFFMSDMVIFSRFTASCLILYQDCFNSVFARLLQVPYDSFQQMATYLGRDQAMNYYNLINQHIIIMVELIQALQAGKQKEADDLLAKWYQNAEDSAAYLASINPYWSKEQWNSLFTRYLQLELDQIMALQTKEYTKSVAVFDELRYHAILMGDTLASGMMQLLNIHAPELVPAEPAPAEPAPVSPASGALTPSAPATSR